MRRVTGLVSAAAIVLFAAGLYAQGKDFTGKWTVDTDKTTAAAPAATAGGGGGGRGPGGGGGGMAGAITNITQTATTLTIARMGADGTAMGTPAVYNLDGSDSKIMQAGRGGGGGAAPAPTEVIANAKWDGATLVITTKGANGDTVAKYSMDGASLKIETTAPGRGGAAGTPRTTFYKKAS